MGLQAASENPVSQMASISGAIAASLPDEAAKRDILLQNVIQLEELIRKTSREENPRPNYERIMRVNTGVMDFERKQKKVEVEIDQEKIEQDIIGSSVEMMIDKIKKERKSHERVFTNDAYLRPIKYFESKGAEKAKMHSKCMSLVTQ